MPFGKHLRADQDVHLLCCYPVEVAVQRAFTPGAVAVDAQDASFGKVLGKQGFHALGAASDRPQVAVAAIWTTLRHFLLQTAMVAVQTRPGTV